MNVNFKHLQKLFFLLVMGFSISVVSSCGDDDEDDNGISGGSGSSSKCYAEVDDNRADYKYAYYIDNANGDELELMCYTIDLMHYYKNPSKINEGLIFSSATLMCLPTTGVKTEYWLELDFNLDLYDVVNNTYDGELHGEDYAWYSIDSDDSWAAECTPIKFAKDGNKFKIEADSVLIYASDEDDCIAYGDSRVTTANFYFEGTAKDMREIFPEASATRSIQAIEVDQEFWDWLKMLRKQ